MRRATANYDPQHPPLRIKQAAALETLAAHFAKQLTLFETEALQAGASALRHGSGTVSEGEASQEGMDAEVARGHRATS